MYAVEIYSQFHTTTERNGLHCDVVERFLGPLQWQYVNYFAVNACTSRLTFAHASYNTRLNIVWPLQTLCQLSNEIFHGDAVRGIERCITIKQIHQLFKSWFIQSLWSAFLPQHWGKGFFSPLSLPYISYNTLRNDIYVDITFSLYAYTGYFCLAFSQSIAINHYVLV